jgi:hypothetical protein
MRRKKLLHTGMCLILVTSLLTGCGSGTSNQTATATPSDATSTVDADMFTNRDYEIGYDESSSVTITLSDDGSTASSSDVTIDGSTITISDEGTYILSGSLTDGMVIIDAGKKDKIQLVLDNVDITSGTSAPIYVKKADKVFVTLASGSSNTLSNGGEFVSIDDNNIDAVIFSKSDLTLNGEGNLTIESPAGHGVVSKDDLVVTSGTYTITASKHGLSGKDSVRIANGTFDITSGKDGLHSENSDDDTLGFTYICGGDFTINADDDGIHAETDLTITDGNINVEKSYEGIEGLTINISGGDIHVVASDDGLNAAGGSSDSFSFGGGGFGGNMQTPDTNVETENTDSSSQDATIYISGGTIYVNAEGDGIDSNGTLSISGGEIYVSGPTNGGNGAIDYETSGTITGGIVIAAGASQMAMNFGSDSTQGSILVTTNAQEAGTTVELKDSENNVLAAYTPEKTYDSVVISCPDITTDETYTFTAGTYSTDITMDSLIYGEGSNGFGMGGGMGGGNFNGGSQNFDGEQNFDGKSFDGNKQFNGGKFGEDNTTDADSSSDSNMPSMPDNNTMPNDSNMPSDMTTPDGNVPDMPDGMTQPDGNMPDGMTQPDGNMPSTPDNTNTSDDNAATEESSESDTTTEENNDTVI